MKPQRRRRRKHARANSRRPAPRNLRRSARALAPCTRPLCALGPRPSGMPLASVAVLISPSCPCPRRKERIEQMQQTRESA